MTTTRLDVLVSDLAGCTGCGLSRSRTKVVVGRGNPRSRIVMLGEAPGETEDMTGSPFVGRAGRRLDTMVFAAGIRDPYILNAVKCRPPKNRTPSGEELNACSAILKYHLSLLDFVVLVALGKTALAALGITTTLEWRGACFKYPWGGERADAADLKSGVERRAGSIPAPRTVLATFHPSYVLRSPRSEPYVVADLRRAAAIAAKATKL